MTTRQNDPAEAGQSSGVSTLLARIENEPFLYLTTTGRVSKRQRTVELWFVAHQEKLFVIPGAPDKTHWVQNLLEEPRVDVRIGSLEAEATARVLESSDPLSETISQIACRKYKEPEPWGIPIELTLTIISTTPGGGSGL